MQTKTLIKKEDVTIDGKKYFISSIPALKAQRMLLDGFGAFANGGVGSLPDSLIRELLSYAGAYNNAGGEVQFVDEDVIEMMVDDPVVLMELESMMVEKNFGFLADGRMSKVMERLSGAFNLPSPPSAT